MKRFWAFLMSMLLVIMEDDKALENATIRFKTTRQKKKNDTFGVVAGYITYAVFPKEELLGCDFSEQSYVLYPGK